MRNLLKLEFFAMKKMRLLLVILALSCLLAACGKEQPQETVPMTEAPTVAPTEVTSKYT